MKKNYNIIKEYNNGNLSFSKQYILIDLFRDTQKNKLFNLFYNMNRYYKKNRLNLQIQNRVNELIKNFNLKFFNDRGIITRLDIFNTKNINNVYVPIYLPIKDISNIKRVINKYINNKNITKIDENIINSINFQLSEVYLNGAHLLLNNLIEYCKTEYNTVKDILSVNTKDEGSIFMFIEKGRYFFVYIYKRKVYPFNIYLKDKGILINKDNVYSTEHNKSSYIFSKFESYKIQKINSSIIEQILLQFYGLQDKDNFQNFEIKNIYKKDIQLAIKRLYNT